MILPNLCCSIRIEPGNMTCVSVVVPHPSYLDEESWTRLDAHMVVDCHTVELMRRYGYAFHKKGSVITGVELNCVDEEELQRYIEKVNEQVK